MPTAEHPMLPYLVDLELAYVPGTHRDYDPFELAGYALNSSDYWAELAIGWLEQGSRSSSWSKSSRSRSPIAVALKSSATGRST